MKVLEEIKVSVYENVYSKKPRVMSFLEVIIMCIHPIYASIINAIRRYYAEGDHAAAQKLKNQLPCFTPAGTFDGAHAIKNFLLPSHIVGLDYDHVKDRLQVIQRGEPNHVYDECFNLPAAERISLETTRDTYSG